MEDYKQLYIETLSKTLSPGSYNVGSEGFACYTGPMGYAAFEAALKEKVWFDYLKLTDEQIQLKFKEALEKLIMKLKIKNMKYILNQEVDHPLLETAPIGSEFILEPETDLFVCEREGAEPIRIDAALIHVHGDSFDEVDEDAIAEPESMQSEAPGIIEQPVEDVLVAEAPVSEDKKEDDGPTDEEVV